MNPSRSLPSRPSSFRHAARKRRPSALRRACALALATLGLQAGASAGSFYWFGDDNAFWNAPSTGPGGTNWSSSGDFNNGTAGLPGAADDVFFVLAGAGNLSTQLGTDFSIRSLAFTPDATNPISIGGGNLLTIGTGGITNNSPTTISLDTAIALGATQTWTNNSAVNPVNVTGVVSGAAANALTIAGAGNFTLTNANTYSGATSVFTGSLTLGGNGSILNTSSISLGAGTVLTLDSATTQNANRITDITGITSRGGVIKLIGNAAGTMETMGTLGVASGASVVQTTGSGSGLVLGAAGTIPSFNRSPGGTVLFAVGAGSTVKVPNVTLTNGIIGGWAVTGTAAGTGLDFATTDGSGNVVPYTGYTPATGDGAGNLTSTMAPTLNIKYDANGNNSIRLQGGTTVNSIYLTGGSVLTGVTGGPTNATFYNGITFGTGITANLGITLTVGTGGIISSGATGIGHYNNKTDIPNMAFIGYQFGEYTGTGATNGDAGQITAEVGISDLMVYTDTNLRIASQIKDNGSPLGLTKSGPGLLDISNGNTQTNKPSNIFTGKVTINEGTLLINQGNQLGASPAASDNVTFNGGELRTFAGLSTTANQGWTVGTRGGVFTYTGGGTSNIQNKITGVGGFTFYTRSAGGGTNQLINLANNPANSGGLADYQGPTNLFWSFSDGSFGSGAQYGRMALTQDNQIPAASALTLNIVDDTSAHNVLPNTLNVSLDLAGHTDHYGSLAGNVNIRNFNNTITIGANGLSTVYTGSLYGAAGQTNGGDTSFPSGTGTLNKVGGGTQTFAGTLNRYSGATNINGGTLLIGSGTGVTSSAALLGTGAVNVGNGSLVGALGGNGSIAGAVTVTSTGQLAPAMSALTFNTLTISNNLTINPGGTLSYNFSSPGNGDRITLSGTGSLNLQAGNDILNVTQLAGFGIGTYPLLVVSGTGTFTDAATFTINGRNNFNYFVLKPGDPIDATAGGGTVPVGQLYLEVLQGNPALTWIGAVSGSWDTSTANWSGDASVFTTGSNVTFDDLGVARPNVTVVAGGVTANSITFANSAVNYTIGGGAVTVTAGSGIVKNQAGTVTLSGSVTAALTTINAGSIAVSGTLNSANIKVAAAGTLSVAGSLGSGNSLNVAGTATFTNAAQTINTLFNDSGVATGVVNLNGPTTLTVSSGGYDGALKGAGSLVKTSNGLLTLTSAASNFAGGVSIQQGTLSVPSGLDGGGPGPLGTSTASIALGAAATAGTLQYSGPTAATARSFTLNTGGGSIDVATMAQTLTVNGEIINGANPLTLTGLGDGVATLPLAGSGNVSKQGSGTWTLAGINSASGAALATLFTVSSGMLTVMSGGSFSTLGAAAVTLNGGTLGLSSTAPGTFDNPVNVAQSATINAFQSVAGGGGTGQTVTLGGTNNVTIAAGRVLTTTTANNYTLNIAGNVTGAGGVTSNGTVALVGTTANYTGATVVSGGGFTVTPPLSGTSSVTVNGGTMTANGGVTTTGAITTNNNGVLNLNATSSTSSLTVNGTSIVTSLAPLTVSGIVSVNGGTLNNNLSLSASSVIVQSGTYNGNGPLTSPGGVTINGGTARISADGGLSNGVVTINGGTLKFDPGFTTTTYAGTTVQNDGTIQAATGTTDLGGTVITTTKQHAIPGSAGVLAERFFRPADAGVPDFLNNGGDSNISFENPLNFATRTPGAIDTLSGGVALTFTGANIQTRANAVVANFYANTDNEGVAWIGRLTVGGGNLLAGPISFGTNSDDGSTIYVDVNRDGVFQGNERIVSNTGSHGVITVQNTVTLAAGVYNFAVGWYNGNGGQQIDAKFFPGSGIPFASQSFINPAIQTDIFSGPSIPGSRIQIDGGATLSAGGFTAETLAFVNGNGIATLQLKEHVSPVTSSADFIQMTGNAPLGSLDLGLGNNVNVVTLNLGSGGLLSKTGSGQLTLTGPGLGTGELFIDNGTVTVDGSVTGTVTVSNGLLRGTGTTGPLHVVNGQLNPGHTTGALNSGDLTFDGGAYTVGILGAADGSFNQTNVTGTVTLTSSVTLNLVFTTYDPQDGVDQFIIIKNDSADGVTLSGPISHFYYGPTELLEGSVFTATSGGNTQQFKLTYAGGDGNDVVLMATPEPGAALCLLGGLATLAGVRRRRRM